MKTKEFTYEEGNTSIICTGCANQRKEVWQKDNTKTLLAPGGFVKVAVGLRGRDIIENMWFIIKAIEGNDITAILDNEPEMLPMVMGEVLVFDRSEIQDYLIA